VTLRPQQPGIPLPAPSARTRPFWDGCARGELWYQRCTSCHRPVFDPAELCRYCGGDELRWEQSAGRGTVYSWSIVWRPQTPGFEVPYAAAIVDVDEGYQLVTNIVGCAPEAIHVGMPVEVQFHPIGDDIVFPYFRPAQG
jgi:uncharacterized OB-fold protein